MTELILSIENANPLDIYGVNNNKLDVLKKAFPRLKVVSRGDKIKLAGNEEDLAKFEIKFNSIILFLQRYGKLTIQDIEELLYDDDKVEQLQAPVPNDVIVYGNNGHVVRARTPNQKRMVELCEENDILFATGPAGTGKTYTAVALAVKALKEKKVKRIILTRPAVEAGENLGFLPGDLKEKIDPYLRPLYDALEDMIPADKLQFYKDTRVIEVAPLAFMRGRTLDHSFIILDEAQNATSPQLKMFLTRIGPNAKCIVTGDETQIDLPDKYKSGLHDAVRILGNIEGIAIMKLENIDVVRHRLVKKIIEAYEILTEEQAKQQEEYKAKQKAKREGRDGKDFSLVPKDEIEMKNYSVTNKENEEEIKP
jgi:phosphate starvation-inducible protein PhoH and related proteins